MFADVQELTVEKTMNANVNVKTCQGCWVVDPFDRRSLGLF
jgi:hypothetical protein